MKNKNTLQFWFEFASTYSYLSVFRIEKLAREFGVQIIWKPFLLGPIFQEQGLRDSPFNVYPAKGKYMWRDFERQCEKYRLDFRRPSQFPRSGLLAARIACVLRENPEQVDFIRGVFRQNFIEDQGIATPESLQRLLQELGLDFDSIIRQANSEENKNLLRRQNEVAKALGIFGAPSFVAGEELFWGNDRLEDALEMSRDR